MPSIRIPLVGSLTDRNPNAALADTVDQQFINCFPEIIKNQITGKTEIWLNKRQGGAAGSDVQASATGRTGAIVWTSDTSNTTPPVILSYLKSTGTSMMFFDETGTQVGADVANTRDCLFMSETYVSGTGTLTATLLDDPSTTLEAWYFQRAGAWTQITSGNFPSTIMASHAHMDGYMFVMTRSGFIHNSDLNSLANWTASNYITMSGGGNGAGLVHYRDFIVGFSDYTTEFFYNAGNAGGSVLSRVRDGVIRIGTQRSPTVPPYFKVVGDAIYFVGQAAESGAKGVYRITGTTAQKISTPGVDKLAANGQVRYVLGSFALLGMTHIAFYSTSTLALCYCVDTGYWWILAAGSITNPSALIGAVNSSVYSKTYLTSADNAKTYTFDPNSPLWQDGGNAYTLTVRTQNQDLGTRRKKYWQALALVGDSQSSSATVSLSYSDNDYSTTTSAGSIDMNTVPTPQLSRLGASIRRSWTMTNNSNTPLRILGLDVAYRLGISCFA